MLCWIHGIDREWKLFVHKWVRRNSLQCPSQFVEPLLRSVESCRSQHEVLLPWTFSEPTLETRTRLVRYGPALDRLRAHLYAWGVCCRTEGFWSTITQPCNNCRRHPRLDRQLLRVTTYLMRAVARFKGSVIEDSTNVTSKEIPHAEMLWIRCALRQLTSQEFKIIQQQCNRYWDKKEMVQWRTILQCRSSILSKVSILMPQNHHLTMVSVKDAHGCVHHNGVR